MQCYSNFLVCGTLFQTEIFHGTPPLICVGNTHKVVVVVKIADWGGVCKQINYINLTVG